MKQSFLKKLTSLALVLVMVISMVPMFTFTVSAEEGITATSDNAKYVKKDLANITAADTVIIVATTKSGSNYAMSNDNGTSKAPAAVAVTVENDSITKAATNILWNIKYDNGNLTIYPAGKTDTWLYCTSTNNGVRVGTNANKVFTLDATSGYLKNTATSRYLGVYNNADWRCYTNTTGNTANQTFAFYVLDNSISGEGSCEHANTEEIPAVDATCTTPGNTAGEKCSDCGKVITPTEAIPAGHKLVNGTCSVCGVTGNLLITSSDELKAGDKIIIACPTKNVAMGVQISNYRAAVDVTIENSILIPGADDIQIVTLGGSDGAWTLQVGEGQYLYWDSANVVKTSGTKYEWTIDITNGIATIASKDTSARTLKYNASSPRFACYAQGQTDLAIYKYACPHANTEEVAEQKATCTKDGYTAGVFCNDCQTYISGHEVEESFGHTDENPVDSKCDTCEANLCEEHTWVDGNVVTEGNCTTDRVVAQVCENCGEPGEDKVTTAPGHTEVADKAVAPTCTETGLTEGSHCSVCDAVIVEQTVEEATGHNYVDGVCSSCGDEEIVTVGSYIYFTANGQYMTGISTSSTTYGEISDSASNALIFQVKEGYVAGTYAFYANGKYMEWPGGTKNSVSWSDTLDANSSWYVTADENGVMTIATAVESSTYGYFAYNKSSTRFATYKTSTVTGGLNNSYYLVQAVKAPAAIKSFSVSLNQGVTIKVNYDILASWLEANSGAKVVFSNGKSVDAVAGVYTYSVDLTPGQINDALTVSIQDASGNVLVADINVSFKAYVAKVKAAGAEKFGYTTEKYAALIELLDKITEYSNAVDGTAVSNSDATSLTNEGSFVTEGTEDVFAGMSGSLNEKVNVYVTLTDPTATYTFSVTLGGKAVVTDATHTGDKIVINGLTAANFNDEIVITLTDSESNVSKITFTFNQYLKVLYNTQADYQNLALATYNYGVALESFKGA